MPKYKCPICDTVKMMVKLDPDCPFCGDGGLGQMELIRGEEGGGQRKRLTQHLISDVEEDSGDWD